MSDMSLILIVIAVQPVENMVLALLFQDFVIILIVIDVNIDTLQIIKFRLPYLQLLLVLVHLILFLVLLLSAKYSFVPLNEVDLAGSLPVGTKVLGYISIYLGLSVLA